jgi:LCP family protein required for cell wall assembly
MNVNGTKKRRIPLIAALSWISVVLAIILIVQIVRLEILPLKLALPVFAIIAIVTLLVFLLYNFVAKRTIARILSGFLVIVLTIGYGVGNYYISKTGEVIGDVTSLTSTMTNTVSVVTLKDSSVTSLKKLDGKTVGICKKVDKTGTQKALDDIESSISIETVSYSTLIDMVDALYNEEVDAIILNESMRGEVHDQEEYTNFNTETQVIHKTKYYTKRSNVQTSDDAVDVTSETFTVLISGNDSYGGLDDVSRSDSNMLVTVNPKTHRVLMTSIPRDYYVSVACASDAKSSCPDGERDKLTHTGLYGVDTTEQTIEDLLGIEINYYARVNFSSLVNLVDALGGINIYVEKGMAVDTFYANSTLKGVHEGWNHLNGERALAYARERHAYTDGDTQRVKNQQQVLRAIIKKITSASMIKNYAKFADALSGAFETNMSSSDITSLIRYQLSDDPSWTFESYALTGETDTRYCATLSDYASVMLVDNGSVKTAKQKINAISNGKKASSVSDQAGELGTDDGSSDESTDSYSTYDGYSQDTTTYGNYSTDYNSTYDGSDSYTNDSGYAPF